MTARMSGRSTPRPKADVATTIIGRKLLVVLARRVDAKSWATASFSAAVSRPWKSRTRSRSDSPRCSTRAAWIARASLTVSV